MTGKPEVPCPQIPGYRLLDKIGEGGTGQVYRATQIDPQRTVAIKLLNLPVDKGNQALAEGFGFQRESRLMAGLSHPFMVGIYDSGVTDGRPYMVMEFISGTTLRHRLQ